LDVKEIVSGEFGCYDRFLCPAFDQLTYRESLKDIETCPNSHHEKFYHGGFFFGGRSIFAFGMRRPLW
jgi:hypothetical protein